MKVNKLLLLSGQDIPFPGAHVNIHQPKASEIALIGEETFFRGLKVLLFSKNDLEEKDKNALAQYSDFNIFMSIINDKNSVAIKTDMLMVLTLMFPDIKFKINIDKILLQLENFESSINEQNIDEFKDIISQMFCLDSVNSQYNPASGISAKIAEKLNQRHIKLAKQRGEDVKEINIINRYVSVLSIGLQIDINKIMNYTYYQLIDAFKRYQSKISYDLTIQAKMAGATGLEEVENWMDELHS